MSLNIISLESAGLLASEKFDSGQFWSFFSLSNKSRRKLLEELLKVNDSNIVTLLYSESPMDEGIHEWITKSPNIHQLEKEALNFDGFLKFLYLGNWVLLSSSKVFDVHLIQNKIYKADDLKKVINEYSNEIEWILYSFHDDEEWSLAARI